MALAQVESELAASGISANPNQATLIGGGLALPPVNAPAAVQAVINAGNEIARLPYIWGGGHERYEDTGYDCSGSLSFVLAAAGLLDQTETSGQLESYGEPGPGKWITIFANAGHTFAYIAGLRFDTVALAETGSRWSNRSADESNLSSFVIRHPAGRSRPAKGGRSRGRGALGGEALRRARRRESPHRWSVRRRRTAGGR